MAKLRVNVDTTKYEAGHAKAPRGYGRWWFEVVFVRANGTPSNVRNMVQTGTYTEAKKAVKAEATALALRFNYDGTGHMKAGPNRVARIDMRVLP